MRHGPPSGRPGRRSRSATAATPARRPGPTTAAATQDKELRRLRAQVAQGEADASATRRATRSDRDEATVRARVLLDTVLEAAAGLRRELALPAVTGNPADRVEAGLADDAGRDAGGRRRRAR